MALAEHFAQVCASLAAIYKMVFCHLFNFEFLPPQLLQKSHLQSINLEVTLQAQCLVRLVSTMDINPDMIGRRRRRDTYVSEGRSMNW